MNEDYLVQLFLKLEERIQKRKFSLKIFHKGRFVEQFVPQQEMNIWNLFGMNQKFDENLRQHFVFEDNKLDEYVCNMMICKWLFDHKDHRYRDFTFVLKPHKTVIDMQKVSLQELMDFISPQTQKTRSQT